MEIWQEAFGVLHHHIAEVLYPKKSFDQLCTSELQIGIHFFSFGFFFVNSARTQKVIAKKSRVGQKKTQFRGVGERLDQKC
jgi:hypothetical protein